MDKYDMERNYSQEEVEAMLRDSYNIESMEAHDCPRQEVKLIGTAQRGNRLYDVHMDKDGHCWYSVRVKTEKGIVSEYEAVFGHKPEERRKRRKATV